MGLMIRGGAAAAVCIGVLARCAAAIAKACRQSSPALAAALLVICSDASADPTCKPRRPRPVVHLSGMGPCAFDPDKLSFFGDPAMQAACLLRPLDHSRNLARA